MLVAQKTLKFEIRYSRDLRYTWLLVKLNGRVIDRVKCEDRDSIQSWKEYFKARYL